MPQSLANILVHLVFSARARAPLLNDAWRDEMHGIAGQQEHHCKVTFQDEYRRLLKKYNLEYDERYVWD